MRSGACGMLEGQSTPAFKPSFDRYHVLVPDQCKKDPRNVTKVPVTVGSHALFVSLHDCCAQGNRAALRAILAMGIVDINERDLQGRTAVHYAARHGHSMIVKELIEEDLVEVGPSQCSCTTLLHYACTSGNEALVEYILQRLSSSASVAELDQGNNKGNSSSFTILFVTQDLLWFKGFV